MTGFGTECLNVRIHSVLITGSPPSPVRSSSLPRCSWLVVRYRLSLNRHRSHAVLVNETSAAQAVAGEAACAAFDGVGTRGALAALGPLSAAGSLPGAVAVGATAAGEWVEFDPEWRPSGALWFLALGRCFNSGLKRTREAAPVGFLTVRFTSEYEYESRKVSASCSRL